MPRLKHAIIGFVMLLVTIAAERQMVEARLGKLCTGCEIEVASGFC
jgi:hypothetical protein